VSVEHTRSLDGLRSRDEPCFGGKSASLGELLAAGIPVPPGFALSVSAFTAFVRESGLEERIAQAMARVSPGDLDAITSASQTISAAMRSAPVPQSVRDEVAQRYAALAEALGASAPPVAVRSSALGEDSQDATFAGQQETYLWVSGIDRICGAVLDCWVSLYSPPAISYRLRLGPGRQAPAMGVTVQVMVDADVSGVMFTCNPVSGDPSMVAVNASWGLGLAVVGGEVTPDEYLVSKVTREVVRERVNHKHVQYVAAGTGRGTVCREVEDERADVSCLDHQALAALVDVGRRVERHFGSHQDVEFAFARGQALPRSLFVVQSRPVTAVKKPQSKPKPASALSLVMSTFGAGRKPRER
jgi:pyruvate, water dikinase